MMSVMPLRMRWNIVPDNRRLRSSELYFFRRPHVQGLIKKHTSAPMLKVEYSHIKSGDYLCQGSLILYIEGILHDSYMQRHVFTFERGFKIPCISLY